MSRWINCGTILAFLGALVFATLGFAVFQILCHGPAGEPGSGWMRFPG
ncbi:MAG TPA: hypothetical protein VFM44_10875 [Gemmatimonadota bacterium]|nr:hypothetical protein [Gemmatimonadota bacterium]